jgi:hypothetical protein
VPARRNPRWTASEVAILREHYPTGGCAAVLALLPERSWYAVHVKASKLGIPTSFTNHAPRARLQGEQLEEAIRLREIEGWSFGKIGALLGVAEASACNAVLMALCTRKGFTPAERDSNGRLTERGMERLRWCLKKGLKGVEIQLRLGVSASCVAEQRRRYNRELKAKGKAPLPPPGAGESYSGVKLSREKKREVESLFLEGFGTAKVSEKSGVAKTSCTRLRSRLIRRLKREGRALPGCDLDGKRRTMRGHARQIPDELRAKVRALILDRVPVRRAAAIAGVGSCAAYRIRDEMRAELGDAMPKPRLPGRVSKLRAEMLYAQAIPSEHLWRFRQLVHERGEDEARKLLRAEIAEARRNESVEDKLRRGAKIVSVWKPSAADYDRTLGGVVGAIL